MEVDDGLDAVAERLDALDRTPLLSAGMVARLCRVDARSLDAGLLGADPAGLYRPG